MGTENTTWIVILNFLDSGIKTPRFPFSLTIQGCFEWFLWVNVVQDEKVSLSSHCLRWSARSTVLLAEVVFNLLELVSKNIGCPGHFTWNSNIVWHILILKNCLMIIWNSNVTEHPVFYLAILNLNPMDHLLCLLEIADTNEIQNKGEWFNHHSSSKWTTALPY